MTSPCRHAPAAERNRGPILDVLRRVLPPQGLVLEIASGTGQHAVHFARALPTLEWQPSDIDPAGLASIDAWRVAEGLSNVRAAIELDVCREPWPLTTAAAVVCCNMIHIAPWRAGEALIRGAGRILPSGGTLVLYGPYRRGGSHTAPSNEAFDADLRARNPEWGVRDLEAVESEAASHGLRLHEIVAMPANNFTVVMRKS
jgi:SAM-dependent methyltransferase